MLKYGEIIENLSLDEKLAILTDGNFLSDAQFENVDVPSLSICSVDDVNQGENKLQYPSFGALANTWDPFTVGKIAKGLSARARKSGANAMLLPSGKVRSNVYSSGYSEDPYYLGTMLNSFVKESSSVGVVPIISNCSISDLDTVYADQKPNARALMEYYLRAYQIAVRNSENFALATSYTHLKGEYEQINMQAVSAMIKKYVANKNTFLLCDDTVKDEEVARLNARYSLCIHGHANVLREAVEYYEALRGSVESGVATPEELEDALLEGSALSTDTVDEAVDSVLRFASFCQTNQKKCNSNFSELSEAELLKIAESTAVLLKNEENVLPLGKGKRVALIGQLAKVGEDKSPCEYIKKIAGRHFVGYSDGYDLNRSRSDDLINEAKSLSYKADVLVVFVGFGKNREDKLHETKCLKLPGSQVALIETLSKLGKKVVIVLTGSGRADMSFDNAVQSVMYMPDMGSLGGQAIARLIYGQACPSGKLSFTMYDEPDERTAKEKFYKNAGYNKVGVFVGYKRYVSDGEKVKYPFGYGLSYTKFKYSGLKINSYKVYVTVKNVGKCEGTEIVQVYFEKPNSTQVRPERQLFGFAKVTLKAGQKKTVAIEWTSKDFEFYNTKTNKFEVEQGAYKIYASSQVQDKGIQCNYSVSGSTLAKSEENLSDYLQGKSNIVSGEYFMDTKTKRKRHDAKSPLFGIVTILYGILWNVFVFLFAEDIEFFHDEIGQLTGWIAFIVFNFLMILGVISLIAIAKSRKRYKKDVARKSLVRKSTVPEKIEKPVSYESLFVEEFAETDDEEEEDEEEKSEENAFVVKETVDHYHKNNWSLNDMQDELVEFLSTRGILLDALQARTLLSAMSVSRLVFLKNDAGLDVELFMRALSEFFAVKPYIDNADKYTTSDDMLFVNANSNNEDASFDSLQVYKQTEFAHALEDAYTDEAAIKIAHLTNVNLSAVGSFMTQFMRYVVKPEVSYNVSAKNKSISDHTFTVTSNLWIFMAIEQNEMVENLPAHIAEPASLVKLRFSTKDPAENQEEGSLISVAQFLSFGNKAKNQFELDEAKWKRVDRLEDYVRARAQYRISNKLFQKMEKYSAVFLALGGDSEQTLDSVVAVKLLANVLALVKNNRKENDDQFFHVMENIFGEDKVNICREIIDCSSVDVDEKWYDANKDAQNKERTAKKVENIELNSIQEEVEENSIQEDSTETVDSTQTQDEIVQETVVEETEGEAE